MMSRRTGVRAKMTRTQTGFDWADVLQQQCKALHLELPVRELRFDPTRRWRFDCAWPARKLAVEIAGAEWANGRHSRQLGADYEKVRAAVCQGWRLLPFTGSEVRSGLAVDVVARMLQ